MCEAVGADVKDVVLGMGYDKRIGHEFLKPGPGWGGSCFPKDSRALVHIAESAGYNFDLLKGVITVNDEQFHRVADKVRTMVGGDLNGKKVAVWGLTFKARTDDIRDSPAVGIAGLLADAGAAVQAYDPAAKGDIAGHRARRRPVLGVRGRRRARRAHRVGRVPLARLRQGRRPDDRLAGGRRPQPARPPCARAAGLRLHRHRVTEGSGVRRALW